MTPIPEQPTPPDDEPILMHVPCEHCTERAAASVPPEQEEAVRAALELADRLANAVTSWKSGHIVEGHAREYQRFRGEMVATPPPVPTAEQDEAVRLLRTVERMVERYGLPGTADSIEDVQRDLATADVDEEAGNG